MILIKKITKAFQVGKPGFLESMKNDSKTLAQTISKQFPDTSIKELSTIIDRYKNADSWYKNTNINIHDYYNLIDVMINGKAIDKKPPLELLITNEFNK